MRRLPKHVSVILTLEEAEGIRQRDSRDKLIGEVADIAAWCASAGIPMLSVYEKTGTLKVDRERTYREISQQLRKWFGRFQAPSLHLHCPNETVIHPRNWEFDTTW